MKLNLKTVFASLMILSMGLVATSCGDDDKEVLTPQVEETDKYYNFFTGNTFQVMYQNMDGVVTYQGATFTAPAKDDENYGKTLTLNLPDFDTKGSTPISLEIRCTYTYDEQEQKGIIAMQADEDKVGVFKKLNLFLRLDNLGTENADESYVTGEYNLEFTAEGIAEGGNVLKRQNRSQNLYLLTAMTDRFEDDEWPGQRDVYAGFLFSVQQNEETTEE